MVENKSTHSNQEPLSPSPEADSGFPHVINSEEKIKEEANTGSSSKTRSTGQSKRLESVKLESLSPPIRLEDIKVFKPDPSRQDVQFTFAEARKNYNTLLSGTLAKVLWYTLGGVVVLHFASVIVFSWRLADKPDLNDTNYPERVKSAIASVNDTAKTLYTFLTPLATAVTGYYFTTIGASKSSNSAEDSEE